MSGFRAAGLSLLSSSTDSLPVSVVSKTAPHSRSSQPVMSFSNTIVFCKDFKRIVASLAAGSRRGPSSSAKMWSRVCRCRVEQCELGKAFQRSTTNVDKMQHQHMSRNNIVRTNCKNMCASDACRFQLGRKTAGSCFSIDCKGPCRNQVYRC